MIARTGRSLVRSRRLWTGAGLGVVVVLLVAAGLALQQFDEATDCAATVPSDPCIAVLAGTVAAPERTEEVAGNADGQITTLHHQVVTLTGTGQQVEFWTFRSRTDLQVGDPVTLQRWKGHLITVSGHGRRVGANGWEPEAMGWMLAVTAVALALGAGLWRLGLVSLEESPRARASRWRSALGWLLLIVAAAPATIAFPAVLCSPRLYLTWW
jgi:hypothetical protein